MTAHFVPPVMEENPNGWGPCSIPEQFKNMPYQPFSKGDRLGKVSDWTGATYQDRKYQSKYASTFGSGSHSQYAYYHDEDETTFQLVDTTHIKKPLYQRGRNLRNQRANKMRQQQRQQQQPQLLSKSAKNRDRDRQRQVRKWQKQYGNRQRYDQKNQAPIKNRESSVTVRPEWHLIEEMDFPRLSKLSLPGIEEGNDLKCCGKLEYYERTYDRVNTKAEKPLQRIDRIYHKVTTTDDPIIRQLSKTEGNVFITDAILGCLMCCTRSVYSWDIVVDKIGDKLFFDKRDNSEFDLLTVSETSNEPPQDDGNNNINSPRSLALEALFINHNFSQQVLKMNEETYNFPEKNPFADENEEGEVASVAYRYRKWDLGNDVQLVCRCEHDAVMHGPNGEVQFINIKALSEWDPRYSGGIEWRQKLDTQRGAVLANELKNNSCKLAKWTIQALLAGSDQLKFGYVSRHHIQDSTRHVILGTQQFKPNEFATQINLSMDNAWGIFRYLADICRKQKDGRYLIIKDPNKPLIRLFDIPDNTFESEEEEDSSDEVDNEEDEDK